MQDKTLVGRAEWCSFAQLQVPAVKARVDSGAATSSLHAYDIVEFEKDGDCWVRFEVHPLQRDQDTIILCEAQVVDRRKIKSSNGESERRYLIQTQLGLGDESWPIKLSLTNRDAMGFRMLLGREAMQDRIIIDPSQKFLRGEPSAEQIQAWYGVTG